MPDDITEPNTAANIETCGFLAGKISQGKLVITHLVIPRQSGTPDSCTTENEEDFLMFLDEHDLITLGWVSWQQKQKLCICSFTDLGTAYVDRNFAISNPHSPCEQIWILFKNCLKNDNNKMYSVSNFSRT